MTDTEMDRAYSADERARRLLDDARRALWLVLDDDTAYSRLGPAGRERLAVAVEQLRRTSEHIVAVWD